MSENSYQNAIPDPLVYSYIKVINLDILKFELQNAGLYSLIDEMTASPSLVTIKVKRILTDIEKQKLYTVIANHRSTAITLDIAKLKIQAAMDFGKQVLIEFAANNVVRGINVAEVKQLTAQFGMIQLLLLNGSLYSALEEIQKLQPNALISQADIAYYSNKIMDFLGIKHG